MSKHQQLYLASNALNRAYGQAKSALMAGKMPDFSAFDEAKKLAEQAVGIKDYVNCLGCERQLEVDTDTYSRLIISQYVKSAGQGEVIQPLPANNQLIYCSLCQDKILKFIDGQTKSGQEGE